MLGEERTGKASQLTSRTCTEHADPKALAIIPMDANWDTLTGVYLAIQCLKEAVCMQNGQYEKHWEELPRISE